MSSSSSAQPPGQRTFLGHPVGLYVLFFTEMWERFSYYGMRALLILYMVNYFKMVQGEASAIYKWYTSLVYLTPLLGGYLADRWLGNKRAVIIGATAMAIGHFLMAFEEKPIFFGALAFLIVGNGFFKPNMSTQVGRLYPQNDARRDGAYTIFYMGINLGAFLSPLICGWLAANTIGRYHTGFTMAGIGMVLGLLVYLFGLRWVKEIDQGERKPITVAGGWDQRLPADFVAALRKLQEQTQQAPGGRVDAHVQLLNVPPGFDLRRAGFQESELRYDPATNTLTAQIRLTDQHLDRLKAAAAGEAISTQSTAAVGEEAGMEIPSPFQRTSAITEQAAAQSPSVVPILNSLFPYLLALIGVGVAISAPILAVTKLIAFNTAISLEIAAVCALISAWVVSKTHNALRDRVLTIYIIGVFVVFFWAAFEQAGNALNLWADKHTERYLTSPAPEPSIYPEVPTKSASATATSDEPPPKEDFWSRWITMWRPIPSQSTEGKEESKGLWESFVGLWNPVATEWFQSINALAIFILAPVFAALWTWLDRRGWNPSIPTKMALGVLLMGLSFALMIGAAKRENQPSSVEFKGTLPSVIHLTESEQLAEKEKDGQLKPYHAGRLRYDKETRTLQMTGVLPDIERDRIVRDTAPESFVKAVKELQKKSEESQGKGTVSVQLDQVPQGLDLKYSGFEKGKVSFDPSNRTLSVTNLELADKDVKALLVAAGEPEFRSALDQLYVKSSVFKVSSWWLFWFYILATLGELCLSPVGLSMVSKLAPAKFATMLMGLWLLTSFFGNFAAGAFGEQWGTQAPTEYFLTFLAALGIAAAILFVLVRKVVAMMHGVN